MKKIIIAIMMVMFGAANAMARPYNNNYNHHRQQRPPHHTTVIKKNSRGENIALGVVTGLVGLAAINSIFGTGNHQTSTVQYVPAPVPVQPYVSAPVYVTAPSYVTTAPASQNCITSIDRYSGTTTTTCTSTPEVREIVYVR